MNIYENQCRPDDNRWNSKDCEAALDRQISVSSTVPNPIFLLELGGAGGIFHEVEALENLLVLEVHRHDDLRDGLDLRCGSTV